ncbi:MAG: peptidylprolyl isomerase [Deltaproteobacteria bacterium]|nr:peptidylprolyl isomerase [Deltaproteobacteria bacterium]RLB60810.1 MAG: peptidylprolyl isomerase [Deltaproteobacteria bacterium]
MNQAQEGDTVTVTFQGVLDDGSIFDASDESAPLTFVLGDNEVLPGLELSVLGMKVNDQKTVIIPPEQGYGIRQSRLVEEVSIEALPKDLDLNVGGQLEVTAEDGTIFQLFIIKRNDQTVILDANHPLAGRSLTLQIEVVSIDRPTLN